ncbi:aryl-alcohol dehydrogenase, partial [Violaceomyces palustris]
KVKKVRLGKSGLRVSEIILGCMSYGNKSWAGWVLEGDEALQHMKHAWDQGINTFDTADAYSNGDSERLVGKFLKQYEIPRDEIVILTKLYFPVAKDPTSGRLMGEAGLDESGFANQHGLSRKHIFDAIKGSLERMGVDYVDMVQCHRFDYNTPIEETMQALHDIVQAGYVRYIGMSSCYAYQFHQMQNYAIQNKLTPFVSMQNYHNLAYREEEREMVPTLGLFGAGMIPWSPLARGYLTRPVSEANDTLRSSTDPLFKKWGADEAVASIEINKRVEKIAKDKGRSMAQVALAWSRSKPFVSAPIIGSTKMSNLDDLVAGLDLELTKEEVDYLEEPYQPCAIKGHL